MSRGRHRVVLWGIAVTGPTIGVIVRFLFSCLQFHPTQQWPHDAFGSSCLRASCWHSWNERVRCWVRDEDMTFYSRRHHDISETYLHRRS
ncbi:hypothetical protein QBC34DRAFT_390809, partial [Podospora aff. communis PSN243]